MKKKKETFENSEQAQKIACAKKTSIGGQALMEGIMMRGPKKSAMAVRNTQGEIVLEVTDISKGKKPFITKIPIARGVYNFVISMVIGYKALMRSAEISGLEEIEEELAKEKAAKKAAKKAKKSGAPIVESATEDTATESATTESTTTEEISAEETVNATLEDEAIPANEQSDEAVLASDASSEATEAKEADSDEANAPLSEPTQAKSPPEKEKEKKKSTLTTVIMIISGVLGVALALGLFIFLPDFIAGFISKPLPNSTVWRPIFAGILKIVILISYMALVCLLKDIRRTF